MMWYSLLFMVILSIAGWSIFPLVEDSIEEHIHNRLALTTEALQTAIKTSADVSVRNRLRAIAEKNREILANLHRQADQGLFSEKEAKKRATEILLSQTIGQTGYIYAITSEGFLAVHPYATKGDRDLSHHWLARAQRDKKEGYLEYNWKNPGEADERAKALYMTYFQPWDWILSVSSYRSEFQTLIKIDDFRNSIESPQFNQGSYAFVLSGSGEILHHPTLQGSIPLPSNDLHSRVFDRIIHSKNGSFTYTVVDERNGNRHDELVFFNYIPEFDWIVVSTADLETAYAPLKRLQHVFLFTLLLAFVLILPLSLYLGAWITHPLSALSAQMRDSSHSATPLQAEESGPGEIGHLAKRFNEYIQRLHHSRRALESEMGERIEAEQQLKLFAKVFENALEGISITDADGTIIAVNRSFTVITGYEDKEAMGQNPRILKSNKHGPEFYERMWRDLKDKGHWSGEIWNRRKNGEAYPEILNISSISDATGKSTHYVAVFHDITEMKMKEEKIKYQAYHDALTGLPNRALAHDRLIMSLATARRKQKQVAVFFIDLDNFKHINDSLGHAAGDVLLQQVGKRLAMMIREEDTVARLGGDEFQIISANITSEQQVLDLANRLLKGFSSPLHVEGHTLHITVSIGGAIFPHDGESAEILTKNADAAMYQAKLKGKNAFSLFTKKLTQQARERLLLDGEFRQALAGEEFTVFYQPQIETASGRVVAVEALVRWQKRDGTLVSPAAFIPFAEETGLIQPLGSFVLDRACETAGLLHNSGRGTIRVAVNLSAGQFTQADLVPHILETLERHSIDAGQLELEITESTMMTSLEDTVATLNLLSDAGISMAIDDFGTGYSSLYYLKKFPIDSLKIDRSFVGEITVDSLDAQIVETIILMARNLGLTVVAEGVETAEQLALLKSFGCSLIQGYYFSKPLPRDELLHFIDRTNTNLTS